MVRLAGGEELPVQRRLRGGEVHDQHGLGEALILFIDHHRESISPLDDGKRAPLLLQDAVQLKAEIASHHGKSGDKACAVHRQPWTGKRGIGFLQRRLREKGGDAAPPGSRAVVQQLLRLLQRQIAGKEGHQQGGWEGRRVLTLTCSASSGWTQTKGSRR